MKLRILVSAFLIFCMFFSLELIAQTGAAKGTARIKGKVTDKEGNPLEGVKVHFSSDRLQAAFDLTTDEKGEWTVMGVAGGMWSVDFIKEGYEQKGISTQISGMGYNKPIELSLVKEVAAPAKEKSPGMDLVEEANRLREAKNFDASITKYEAAFQANPKLYGVYMDIARIHRDMGNLDKAIEAYRKFLAGEPANVNAKAELASVLLKKGNTEEAKKILSEININEVSDPYLLYNLGVGLYNAQDIQGAIQYWEKTIALDPKLVDAHFQLALAYYADKETSKAKAAFQKVIELAPGSENAKSAQEMLDTMTE